MTLETHVSTNNRSDLIEQWIVRGATAPSLSCPRPARLIAWYTPGCPGNGHDQSTPRSAATHHGPTAGSLWTSFSPYSEMRPTHMPKPGRTRLSLDCKTPWAPVGATIA